MLKVVKLVFLLFTAQSAMLWAAESMQETKPVLRLGMYHSIPYYFTENVAEPHGLSLDLLKPAARQLGIRIEVVPCPFPRCLKMAEDGDIDVVGGLMRSAERESFLYFIKPAMMNFLSSFAIYSRVDQTAEVHQIDDLDGHTVAVMRNALYFAEFDQNKAIERVPVNTEAISLDMVYKGRVDFAITVEQTAAGSFEDAGLKKSDLKRQPYHFEQNIRGYLAFSRKSKNFFLVEPLETLLQQQYKAGMFHLLWQKYRLPAIRSAIPQTTSTATLSLKTPKE